MTMQKATCAVCSEEIPAMRLEYLCGEGHDPETFTCIKHSNVRKKKGLFLQPADGMGENEFDSSNLIIVDKIYDDSVRSVFRHAAEDADPEAEVTEPDADISNL